MAPPRTPGDRRPPASAAARPSRLSGRSAAGTQPSAGQARPATGQSRRADRPPAARRSRWRTMPVARPLRPAPRSFAPSLSTSAGIGTLIRRPGASGTTVTPSIAWPRCVTRISGVWSPAPSRTPSQRPALIRALLILASVIPAPPSYLGPQTATDGQVAQHDRFIPTIWGSRRSRQPRPVPRPCWCTRGRNPPPRRSHRRQFTHDLFDVRAVAHVQTQEDLDRAFAVQHRPRPAPDAACATPGPRPPAGRSPATGRCRRTPRCPGPARRAPDRRHRCRGPGAGSCRCRGNRGTGWYGRRAASPCAAPRGPRAAIGPRHRSGRQTQSAPRTPADHIRAHHRPGAPRSA